MADANQLYEEGHQLMQEGRNEDAIGKLQEALAADDTHVMSHLTLSRLYSLADKHEDAIRHGERVCELDPSDAIHFTMLSVTYQRALAATGDPRYMELAERARDRGQSP